MSNFSDYASELTNQAAGKFVCTNMIMNYVDGGIQERYVATIIMGPDRKVIEVTVPGNTNREDIFQQLIGAANAQNV